MSNNIDFNNLHPSPSDEALKFDEALRGYLEALKQSDIEGLEASIADIERRLRAANG